MKFVVDGERTSGLELVERLLADGQRPTTKLTPETAAQAIEALEHLDLPWLVEEIIESGERFAEQVHSLATRGLQEVVQNADDQGATDIRFGFRQRGERRELLIAHNGNPVELVDVVRMAWPLLSGSRADPEKIGRFGIGLKTLNQLGDRLAVHCPPLPGFQIQGGRIKRTRAAPAVRNFWNPGKRETLFVLRLAHAQFDFRFFKDWLAQWDASSLIHLRHLRDVSLTSLSSAKRRTAVRSAIEVGKPKAVNLKMPNAEQAEQVTIKDASSARKWTRYRVRYRRPKKLVATHKQLGETVLLQLSVPERAGERTRVYVGLPLEEECDLPFSFSAPFEPNVERTRLRDNNDLNEWLIRRIGDLATAVCLRRFEDNPKTGWRAIPLAVEGAGGSTWVANALDEMATQHRDRVRAKVKLRLADGGDVRLGELVYEPSAFESLIAPEEIERLWRETSLRHGAKRAVSKRWRDGGRWRDVLAEVDGAAPLPASACLSILDWPDAEIEPRGAGWLVGLIDAALRAEEAEAIWKRKCIALANDGGRISPADVDSHGTLLVHTLPRGGLAASLGLAEQIARPFRSRQPTATSVRAWLGDKGVLREKASDADALRALAGANREEPLELRQRDRVLLRIRAAFDQLPAQDREAIGRGIGLNIALSGHVFEKGKKSRRAVRPGDSYLPSAIDKTSGWPTAAGETPNLPWVDARYGDVLRGGARGYGALAFLKLLGAATAPRLEPGPSPPDDPNALKLRRRRLCAQHRDELSELPEATGLRDDWTSPDLDAVLGGILKEKKAKPRRKRARALFLCLDRAWEEHYARRCVATAVHHRYSWVVDGEVSATWVARLASEPWLSTRESRLKPAPPRELTVFTEASFEIEGEHLEIYVREIDAEQVDSPVIAALSIQGRPFASSIVARLESMRDTEAAGTGVAQQWADRCYRALASYAPGGHYEDRSDISARELRSAFAARRRIGGLIRVDGRWLSPREVRRDPYLDESLPRVKPEADPLWKLLDINQPSAADCAAVLRSLAAAGSANRSSEINVFRRLLALNEERRLTKSALGGLPLRIYGGWDRRKGKVYAVENPALAEALGESWPVWQPPLPLAELAPLLSRLDLELLEESSFTPDIPAQLAASTLDSQAEFNAAVGHLQDYLAIHHLGLHDRLSAGQWAELKSAHVLVGDGWAIRVRAPGRRSERLEAPAYLFRDPLRLCLRHEDEIAAHDSGGQAIAGYFVGNEPAVEARSTLALAWTHAFSVRDREREEIDILPHDEIEDAPPTRESFESISRRSNRKRIRRKPTKASPKRPAPRALVDLEDLDIEKVEAAFLEDKRHGKLKSRSKIQLASPERRRANGSSGTTRSGLRHYTDREREDVALAIVEAVLRGDRGLNLEDIRDEHKMGADAVDRQKDIWVELKAHGQDASETLRLEPSEAERAKEKRGRYWLVVVWGLEAPRTPEFVVIPDPLRRLDTYLGRGLLLTGLRELTERSKAKA